MTRKSNGKQTNPGNSVVDHQAQWEKEFFQQITQYLNKPDGPYFCRLHFLCTNKQKIYVLDKEGWWHTLSGNVGNVRKRLQSEGDHHVEVVQVRNSSRGWIAYFARSSAEEPGVGWNDRGLVVVSEDKNLQRRVRKAQKAYLGWVLEQQTRKR